MSYYNGAELLSQMDINGLKPEIYMVTTNRTGGKTTYFGRLLVNRFLKRKERFVLLYRFNYELKDVADKFFKDIGSLFFQDHQFSSIPKAKDVYNELTLDGELCGYAIALNQADTVKKLSHLFNDTSAILFDEFQSETNKYCDNEIKKFISIHTSLARGHGKQVRYLPVYMCANPVSIMNPYYVEFGIHKRLRADTHFLKGDGFVLEQGYVESAALAQSESGFNRAFASNSYTAYAAQAVYLNDDYSFVEKLDGRCKYLCTVRSEGRDFGIYEYPELGLCYCSPNFDASFPLRIAVTTQDHRPNYIMLQRGSYYITYLRGVFDAGCFRFRDLNCKSAVFNLVSHA